MDRLRKGTGRGNARDLAKMKFISKKGVDMSQTTNTTTDAESSLSVNSQNRSAIPGTAPFVQNRKQSLFNFHEDYDDAVLQCPVCGHEHSQLAAVEVRGGIGEVAGLGVRIDGSGLKTMKAHVGRGVAVDIELSCECGHDYVYTFEFYKGQIQVSRSERPGTRRHSIWRD